MFGYIVTDKPNMLIKDHAEYRAYYCGLCKTLGTRYNQLMRFLINYDITFLALIAHNYLKVKPNIKCGRCVAKPVGEKFPIVQNNEILEKIADVNIILGYFKALDDCLDSNGSTKYKVAYGALKGRFKVAKNRMNILAEEVKICYEELRELEKNKEPSVDKLAHPFAKMLQKVSIAIMPNSDENLLKLCYNLGRWIYLVDAYNDLEDDYKMGAFNPFIPDGTLNDKKRAEIKESATFALKTAINEIRTCYDNMDITISEGALSNVVYLGLKTKTYEVLGLMNV